MCVKSMSFSIVKWNEIVNERRFLSKRKVTHALLVCSKLYAEKWRNCYAERNWNRTQLHKNNTHDLKCGILIDEGVCKYKCLFLKRHLKMKFIRNGSITWQRFLYNIHKKLQISFHWSLIRLRLLKWKEIKCFWIIIRKCIVSARDRSIYNWLWGIIGTLLSGCTNHIISDYLQQAIFNLLSV